MLLLEASYALGLWDVQASGGDVPWFSELQRSTLDAWSISFDTALHRMQNDGSRPLHRECSVDGDLLASLRISCTSFPRLPAEQCAFHVTPFAIKFAPSVLMRQCFCNDLHYHGHDYLRLFGPCDQRFYLLSWRLEVSLAYQCSKEEVGRTETEKRYIESIVLY